MKLIFFPLIISTQVVEFQAKNNVDLDPENQIMSPLGIIERIEACKRRLTILKGIDREETEIKIQYKKKVN